MGNPKLYKTFMTRLMGQQQDVHDVNSSELKGNVPTTAKCELLSSYPSRTAHGDQSTHTYISSVGPADSSQSATRTTSTPQLTDWPTTPPMSMSAAKADFILQYPEYFNTIILDETRKTDFPSLDQTGLVYLDYTGANLQSQSLIYDHARILISRQHGNLHSINPASAVSESHDQSARWAVVDFVGADERYDVVWTGNASGAMDVVAGGINWRGKRLLVTLDSHNCVNGLAKVARDQGADVDYVDLDSTTCAVDEEQLKHKLRTGPPGIVIFTGQSNVTGAKADPKWFALAKSLGWTVGLDAAALAPSSSISLSSHPVDFLCVSFYKIHGYPTGIGALIITKFLLSTMASSSFSGGTTKAVHLPSLGYVPEAGHAAFERGTINFLAMSAIPLGLEFIGKRLPAIQKRNGILMRYLVDQLRGIVFNDGYKTGMMEIRGPSLEERGAVLPLLFMRPEGGSENYHFIVWAAGRENIAVRGSQCLCNPGASAYVRHLDEILRRTDHDVMEDVMALSMGNEGIIRISLGVASNFEDCYKFVQFCKRLSDVAYYHKLRSLFHRAKQGGLHITMDARGTGSTGSIMESIQIATPHTPSFQSVGKESCSLETKTDKLPLAMASPTSPMSGSMTVLETAKRRPGDWWRKEISKPVSDSGKG